MRRAAEWALYVIGAMAIGYLALYLYAALTRPNFQPGDPIQIFRKPDAPNYSASPKTGNIAQLTPCAPPRGIHRRSRPA
jgi:hypothetical protein